MFKCIPDPLQCLNRHFMSVQWLKNITTFQGLKIIITTNFFHSKILCFRKKLQWRDFVVAFLNDFFFSRAKNYRVEIKSKNGSLICKFSERRNNNRHKYKNKTFIREYPHIPPPIISEPTAGEGGRRSQTSPFPWWQRPCAYLEAKDSHRQKNPNLIVGRLNKGVRIAVYIKKGFLMFKQDSLTKLQNSFTNIRFQFHQKFNEDTLRLENCSKKKKKIVFNAKLLRTHF